MICQNFQVDCAVKRLTRLFSQQPETSKKQQHQGESMQTSTFGFNEGEALYRLASIYPTLRDVLLEIIQNALDMNADKIWLTVNKKSRSVSVRDNGDGATQARFEQALHSVGKGIKTGDKMGRFGIGLVSPFGKCIKFSFTSTPKNNNREYLEWTFVCDDIRSRHRIGGIPVKSRSDLQFSKGETRVVSGISQVNWRTEVRMDSYTKDAQINKVTVESLRDGVLDRFSAVMRRNKVVIVATFVEENGDRSQHEIRAKDFTGQKLPEFEHGDPKTGKTVVRLYLARTTEKGSRRGRILIGETNNDFRLDFSTFIRSLPDVCELSEDTLTVLRSGFFEGEILNSRISLNANRKSFELNEALMGFCIAIDTWYQKSGRHHFDDAKDQRQSERYQQLGVRSMRIVEEVLKQDKFAALLSVVQSFKRGSIGKGHVDVKGKSDLHKAVTTQVVKNTPSDEPVGTGENLGSRTPKKENTGHRPYTVAGPHGSTRVAVRSNSLGLQLAHEGMHGSDNLWVLDENFGVIKINVLHPLWVQCEESSDRALMQFQEYIMIQALSLYASKPEWQASAKIVLDTVIEPYAFMLVHGDALAGRKPGRKKADGTQSLVLKKS